VAATSTLPNLMLVPVTVPWMLRSMRAFQDGALGNGGLGRTLESAHLRTEDDMGDRTQRIKGKGEEAKGRVKREAGIASGRPGTEARGAGEELKGKAKNATGKARSAVKKATR
jgi:uncharacterized protein YjbJ (UPF0337 family)